MQISILTFKDTLINIMQISILAVYIMLIVIMLISILTFKYTLINIMQISILAIKFSLIFIF